jgi:hypothetical protein
MGLMFPYVSIRILARTRGALSKGKLEKDFKKGLLYQDMDTVQLNHIAVFLVVGL